MIDAMACGAVLIASDQTCVREYVEPGVNALLVDFFDFQALADQTLTVLADPPAHRHLGEAAARTIFEKYSLEISLPRIKEYFQRVAASRGVPSLLLEKLVKTGTLPVVTEDPRELARKARATDPPWEQ